ncbi:hypothetical protein AXX17_AT4G23390 [Arabidopsis thaliana]|uniref:F-box associated beta-propeller type 3 domain-containing protein n=2 Tax=Arabidopsis TaxID=3701 RepID=A0A178V5Y3_ARATH|nr:hypothetical protein AXX17_AT4G23390 [Arabidopsis thaliana]
MKGYYLSHVLRGLMCFVKEPSVKIYNTTTRQLVVLPDIEESNIIAEDHKNKKIMYRIGHDPVGDQYKVVCIVARPNDEFGELRRYLSEHWVFILGGDKSSGWRKIPCPSPHLPITQILSINGRMHYLAWVQKFDPMLVTFDFSSEEISILQAPEDIRWFKSNPIEYYGKVALLNLSDLKRECTMNLWVMEDVEKNMWSEKTLVVHPSQMDIVKSTSLRVADMAFSFDLAVILQRERRRTKRRRNFRSSSDNSHLKTVLLSLSSRPDSDITMSSSVIDQDLTMPGMKGYQISHVFRGLMCLVKKPSAQIYNTTTRQLVVLPDIKESTILAEEHKSKKIMYHIGHDPVYDQYKVVCIVSRASDEVEEYTFLSEHWVLLLEGEGSRRWRKISCKYPPHVPLGQGLTLSGRMHYLAWVRVSDNRVLVIFDTHSEEFSMLQVPEDIFWKYNGLLEYGGKIAILNYTKVDIEGVMELWVVEDEEKNLRSSKILVVNPLQLQMVNSIISLTVLGTTRNGEVILVPGPEDKTVFNILLYDLQKNHIRKIEIKGGPDRYLNNIWEVVGMDDVENLMYL